MFVKQKRRLRILLVIQLVLLTPFLVMLLLVHAEGIIRPDQYRIAYIPFLAMTFIFLCCINLLYNFRLLKAVSVPAARFNAGLSILLLILYIIALVAAFSLFCYGFYQEFILDVFREDIYGKLTVFYLFFVVITGVRISIDQIQLLRQYKISKFRQDEELVEAIGQE